MPYVSVIIPAFNPGRFLQEAVESVLCQSFEDWELIIVDDGSTEDIAVHVSTDNRIRTLRQENAGLSAARNFGILHATGELVAFLDADDVWEKNKLLRQIELLDAQPAAVLSHAQMRFIDELGEITGMGWAGVYQTYDDLLDGCGVCVSSVVIRRVALYRAGLFDPLLCTAQDFDLWLRVTRLGRMAPISDPLVRYRMHSLNMSRNYLRTYYELRLVLRRHLVLARRDGDASRVRGCRRGLGRVRRNVVLQGAAVAIPLIKDRRLGEAGQTVAPLIVIAPVYTLRVFGKAVLCKLYKYLRRRKRRVSVPEA